MSHYFTCISFLFSKIGHFVKLFQNQNRKYVKVSRIFMASVKLFQNQNRKYVKVSRIFMASDYYSGYYMSTIVLVPLL